MVDKPNLVPAPLANRYQLQQTLGSGGMAMVYKAWDTRLERPVAVKILVVFFHQPYLLGIKPKAGPAVIHRFDPFEQPWIHGDIIPVAGEFRCDLPGDRLAQDLIRGRLAGVQLGVEPLRAGREAAAERLCSPVGSANGRRP